MSKKKRDPFEAFENGEDMSEWLNNDNSSNSNNKISFEDFHNSYTEKYQNTSDNSNEMNLSDYTEQKKNGFWQNIGATVGNFSLGAINAGIQAYKGASRTINNSSIYSNAVKTNENFVKGLKEDAEKEGKDTSRYDIQLDKIKEDKEKNENSFKDNQQKVQNIIDKNNEYMQALTDSATGKVGKFIAGELAPNIGQNALYLGTSMINPLLGATTAFNSAYENYTQDGINRGMSEEQAEKYGMIMGGVEGGTELISIGNTTKAVKGIKNLITGTAKEEGKKLATNSIKSIFKDYGIGIADEFIQESITDPIQEATASAIGGKDKAEWDGIVGKSLKDGIMGALTSAITGGAGMGINSCIGVVENIKNGKQPTQSEIKTAVKDASKVINIEDEIKNSMQYESSKLTDSLNVQNNNQNGQIQENNFNQRTNQVQNENSFKDNFESQNLNNSKKPDEILDNFQNMSFNDEQNSNLTQNQLPKIKINDDDNLISSAKKYKYNSNDESIQNIQKAFDKKGIQGQFNKSYFNDTNEGAKIIISTDQDGNTLRKIIFNPNADEKTIVQEMAVHELTHDIFAKNTKTGQDLYNEISEYLKNDTDYEKNIQSIKDSYLSIKDKDGNQVFNEKDSDFESMIEEEAVAKAMQTKFGTQEEINRLVREKRTLSQKIYDWVKDKIDNFKNRNDKEYLFWKDVQNKFEKAYNEEGNYNYGEQNAKYHVSASLDQDIDYLLNNGAVRGKIQVRDYTPKNLVDLGIKDAPIVMQSSHIIENIMSQEEANKKGINGKHFHGLGKETFIRAIDSLDNPVGIFQWQNNSKYTTNDYIVLTNVTDSNMEKIIVPLYLKYDSKNNVYDISTNSYNLKDSNEIKSVYGKNKIYKYLSDKQKNNEIKQLYFNKKNSSAFGRVQSSTNASAITNIQQNNNNVNTISKDSISTKSSEKGSFNLPEKDSTGRKLSEKQKKYFKDSKVRDDDGNLKVMYHGTDADFNIFNYDNYGKTGTSYGKGFYFTDNKEAGKAYGKNLKEVYLDIKKPMEIGKTTMSKEDYGRFVKAIDKESNGVVTADYGNIQEAINEYDYGGDDIDLVKAMETESGLPTKKVYEILRNTLGYDGIKANNKSNGKDGNYYLAFNSDQIKNVDNTQPTNNPDIRYSNDSKDFDTYLENRIGKEGTRTSLKDLKLPIADKYIKNRTIPNESNIPITEKNENKLNEPIAKQNINKNVEDTAILPPSMKSRKFYKSIIDSSNTSKEAKQISKKLMGVDTYVPESNKETLKFADNNITKNGVDNSLNSLTTKVNNNDKITAVDIATGERLIEYYSKIGDSAKLQQAIQTTAFAGTDAGRTVQAFAMLNHMTPQGQVVWIQRSIDKVNQRLAKTRKDGAQFDFTPEMQNKILSSSKENMYDTIDEVYKELGQQVSKSKLEQFNEWRYFAMLGNPKTHIRNVVGNIAMSGVQKAKNKIAGAIEDTVMGNNNVERFHTLKAPSQETLDFVKNDSKNRDVLSMLGANEDKYNPQSRLQQAQRTYKSDTLENTLGKLYNFNSDMLSKEDVNVFNMAGLIPSYKTALAEYITANKIDTKNISDTQLQKARQYAVQQAQEATFHQANKLATMLQTLENNSGLVGKVALGGVVPFKKTPINVAITGAQYSPVGLVDTLTRGTVNLQKGNINVNQYIDSLSKGLTGTGIAFLGYALTSAGFLKASGGDDDKEDYEEDQGNQSYSIRIGNKTYSLDWLAPAGIPLFIGSELYQIAQTKAEEKTGKITNENQIVQSLTNLLDATATAMNPMSEMSMISGLTSALKSYAQGSTQALANMGTNMVKSYVTQVVPTTLGQVAKTLDGKERQTTSTQTNIFSKAVNSAKNQMMSKIPGLRQLLPVKTDVWGNEQKASQNIIENAVLPWNTKEIKSNDTNKEITRLYDSTGEKSIIPDTYIDKTMKIAKETYRLSDTEYAELKKKYGQTSYNILSNLFKSSDYKNLTDEQKVKSVKEAYLYAKASMKVSYANWNNIDTEASSTYKKVQSVIQNGGDAKDYFAYVGITDGMEKNDEKIQALKNSTIGSKSAIYESTIGSKDEIYNSFKNTSPRINNYLDYKLQDFTSDKDEDDNVIYSAKDKFYDYMNSSNFTYEQKLYLTGTKYKLSSVERDTLADYIDSLDLTEEEREDMYDKLKGAKVKNGEIYY